MHIYPDGGRSVLVGLSSTVALGINVESGVALWAGSAGLGVIVLVGVGEGNSGAGVTVVAITVADTTGVSVNCTAALA